MKDNGRVRVVFVIAHLVQGGSERYLYEVCRALDPERFEVEILFRSRPRRKDHYYWKLRELGVTVRTKLPAPRNFARVLPIVAETRAWKALEDAAYRVLLRLRLRGFFDRYDVINIIQIENHYYLQDLLAGDPRKVIYLMSNGFQYSFDLYGDCDPDEAHRFVIMDPTQESDLAGSARALNYETLYFPLALDVSEHPPIADLPVPDDGPAHIACFIRLSPQRPIVPLFRCLERLTRTRDAVFHVYGSGDPAPFLPVLDELGIRDRVVFAGHESDMRGALIRDGISLVWMTCHGPVLGYASLEVASLGVPMVFSNIGDASYEEIQEATAGAVHAFQTPEDVAQFTERLLASPAELAAAGERLRQYVVDTRDIRTQIHVLEDYLHGVAAQAR